MEKGRKNIKSSLSKIENQDRMILQFALGVHQ